MNGVFAVRYLLAHKSELTARVPADHIFYGVADVGDNLPAIVLTQISGVEWLSVSMSAPGPKRERVQVTVFAATYLAKKEILALVGDALPLSRGTVDGINVDSITPDGEGPDLDDPSLPLFTQSQDYIVNVLP